MLCRGMALTEHQPQLPTTRYPAATLQLPGSMQQSLLPCLMEALIHSHHVSCGRGTGRNQPQCGAKVPPCNLHRPQILL